MVLRYGVEAEDFDKRELVAKPRNINEMYRAIHAYLNKKGLVHGKDYECFITTVFQDYLKINWGDLEKCFYAYDLYPTWKKDWDNYCEKDRVRGR